MAHNLAGMPFSVFKPAKVNRWYVKYKGRQYSTRLPATAENRGAADQYGWKLHERFLLSGEIASRRRNASLRQCYDLFMEEYGCLKSKKTQDNYRCSFQHLVVRTSDPLTLSNLRQNVRDGIKRSKAGKRTLQTYRNGLMTIVLWWKAQAWLPPEATINDLFQKAPPKAITIYEDHEIEALLRVCDTRDTEWGLLVRMLVLTGMRIHEPLELTWGDVHTDYVRIISKDGVRNESIPMFTQLQSIFKGLLNLRTEETKEGQKPRLGADERVFRWKPGTYSRLRTWLIADCKGAGIEYRAFHTFRRTLVTRMGMESVDVRLAAGIARMSVQVMMKHYNLVAAHPKRLELERVSAIAGASIDSLAIGDGPTIRAKARPERSNKKPRKRMKKANNRATKQPAAMQG